jgi:disulfide oxidoreductase YuzD
MATCTYCGSNRNMHQDHVRAQSRGGTTTVAACAKCNQSKSDKQLMVWLRGVKKNDPYRWNRIKNQNNRKRSSIANKIQKIRDEK